MWNPPSYQELLKLPYLHSTENMFPEERIIHMHFFLGGCDWYAAEFDPLTRMFFGYIILYNDLQNAEWGHFSLEELVYTRDPMGIEVYRDSDWIPKKAFEIDRIRQHYL